MDYCESKTSLLGERLIHVGITGAGTSAPTVRGGHGVTVTRTGTGVIKFSFVDNPGTFVGIRGYMFGADTPGDVKGYTVTRDTYTAPSGSTKGFVEVSLWNSSFAAVDLGSGDEYLDITFAFSTLSRIT